MLEHGTDHLFFELGLAAVTALFVVLWWLIRKQFERYDGYHKEHFKHANETEIHQETMSRESLDLRFGALKGQLDAHALQDIESFKKQEESAKDTRKTLQWLGDCMLTLGTTLSASLKVNLNLPKRPE